MKIRVTINRKIGDEWYKNVKTFDDWNLVIDFMSNFEKDNKFVKFEVLLIRE